MTEVPLSFIETALASGLGAAAGAGVAFLFNSLLERRKSRRAQMEAGHVALAILRSKIQDVRMYEAAWQDCRVPPGPFWWQFKPYPLPVDKRRIDIASLGFLFTRHGSAALASDIRDAEHTYEDLTNVIEEYRKCYVERLLPAMFAIGISEQLTATQAEQAEGRIRRDVILTIRDIHRKLEVRITVAPEFIRRAASNLHRALRAAFPHQKFESPEPAGRFATVTAKATGNAS